MVMNFLLIFFAMKLYIGDTINPQLKNNDEVCQLILDQKGAAFITNNNTKYYSDKDMIFSFNALSNSSSNEFDFSINDSLFRFCFHKMIKELTIDNYAFEEVFIASNQIPILEALHFFFEKTERLAISKKLMDKYSRNEKYIFFPVNYSKVDLEESITFSKTVSLQDYVKSNKKLSILWPNMHNPLIEAISRFILPLGHEIQYTEPKSFKENGINLAHYVFNAPPCRYSLVTYEDVLKNPPDIIFINCKESEEGLLKLYHTLLNKGKKVTLCHFSGNQDVPYITAYVSNLISIDNFTHKRFPSAKISFWYPSVKYISSGFSPFVTCPLIAGSYLSNHYKHHSDFRPAKLFFDKIKLLSQKLGIVINDFTGERLEVFNAMKNTAFTYHIKNFEGFGFTIIESLTLGRPVVIWGEPMKANRLKQWCIANKTCMYLEEDIKYSYYKLLSNLKNIEMMQKDSYEFMQSSYNDDLMIAHLEYFLSGAVKND